MALGMEAGLYPGHIVLDGDPAPPQKRGHNPQFSAHVYCGQTAVCIRIPLGTVYVHEKITLLLEVDEAHAPVHHTSWRRHQLLTLYSLLATGI